MNKKNRTQKTILFMDNKSSFLDVHARLLQQEGYHVLKATSLQEARKKLAEKHIHLAIFDIRMEDEGDEQDISGLVLAQEEAYQSIPKIILTAYPSYQYAREALGPRLDGLSPAVSFIGKAEGPNAMLQEVRKVFDELVHINWDLKIHWEAGDKFFSLANVIGNGTNPDSVLERAKEVEDLFRKLFHGREQIVMGTPLIQREGQVFLKVFVHSKERAENQFIVSCGQRRFLTRENENYKKYAPKREGTESTEFFATAETVHFLATAYELVGSNLEEIVTFKEFYRSQTAAAVRTTLDHLFNTTLSSWSSQGKHLDEWREASLNQTALSAEELDQRIKSLCDAIFTTGLVHRIDYSPHKLVFHFLDGASVFYPNPASYLYEGAIGIEQPMVYGITHGGLDTETVLVNRQGKTWLVYFTWSGQRALISDYLSFEMAIRFDLPGTDDMQVRHEMERRLLVASPLNEAVDDEDLDPEIQKALHTIRHNRYLALPITNHDIKPYLVALFFKAIDLLAAYNSEEWYPRHRLIPYAHTLLLAAMLCENLALDLPGQAIYGLWIDESDKIVWLKGRKINLAPQEYDLLAYLYQHQGKICGRTAIAEQVFGTQYEEELSDEDKRRMEEGRINTTVSRLRGKLGAEHEQYIVAVRGEGYRLELEGPSL